MNADPMASLNTAQRRAATFGSAAENGAWSSAPLLVIAGAGTGKTTTPPLPTASHTYAYRGHRLSEFCY